MATSTLTQMNVRIEENIKIAGDTALAEIGYTPTEVVRNIWYRAAQRGQQLADVQKFLGNAASANAQEAQEKAARHALVEKGFGLARRGLKERGIEPASYPEFSDTNDLIDYLKIQRAKEEALI